MTPPACSYAGWLPATPWWQAGPFLQNRALNNVNTLDIIETGTTSSSGPEPGQSDLTRDRGHFDYRSGPRSSMNTVGSDENTSASAEPCAMLKVSSQYVQPRIPAALLKRSLSCQRPH